jgi:hypothetical protein
MKSGKRRIFLKFIYEGGKRREKAGKGGKIRV